jgi:two-component system sensor histidine kinase UhpB
VDQRTNNGWPTSLRAQLILIPILILFAGLLSTVGIVLLEAQVRIATEIKSGMQLGEDLVSTALRNVREAGSPALAFRQLKQDLPHVRHVQFELVLSDKSLSRDAQLRIGEPDHRSWPWLAWLLAPPPRQEAFPVMVMGQSVGEIRLRSNPVDEIAEILGEIELFCGAPVVLCLLLVGTLLWALRRSLGSVQLLMEGLDRLARGEYRPIPPLRVRELRRVGEQLNILVQSLRRLTADNHLLIGKLLSVQEQERKELAAGLHDEFGPALFGIRAETACMLRMLSNETERDARLYAHARAIAELTDGIQKVNYRILDRLRPLVLEQMGVCEALRELVAAWEGRYPEIAWSLDISFDFKQPDDLTSLVLYRVAQEAVTNVIRHAEASAIAIRLDRQPDKGDEHSAPHWLVLSVCDNGKGLPPGFRYGFGLLGMRERVRQLGGLVEISDARPAGLVVSARVPERTEFPPREFIDAYSAD